MSGPAHFRDRFQAVSGSYAACRPGYPAALFEFLAGMAPARRLAWDCGTGTGQAAAALVDHFDRVAASDASRRQLAHAVRRPGIHYHLALAQRSALADGSADLVSVAQALHWFPLEPFFAEARRVLKPGGVLAVWTYGRARVTSAIDRCMGVFYDQTIGPWWPPERHMVDSGYAGVPFPFPELPAPALEIACDWTLDHFLGYVRTWSAVVRYRAERGDDPVTGLERQLLPLWDRPDAPRRVTWPLALRAGRVT